ncbi:MAG: hypothetical protein ACYDCK_02120, partial [Thermoplasmatota archaeon]
MRSLFALGAVLAFLAASLPLPEVAAGGPNDPTNLAWSPYATSVAIRAAGLAKNGTTFAIALGDASTIVPPAVGGIPLAPASSDLVVFDAAQGHLFNSSELPKGKSAVGVSGNGKVVVAGNALSGGFAVTGFNVNGVAPPAAGGGPGPQGPAWSTSVNGGVTSIAVDRTGDLTAVGVASSATEGHTLLLNSAGTAVIDHTNP